MRTVLTLLCGVTLLAASGCAIQGGVEVEGRASQVSPPPSTAALPSGTPVSADPIAILRADPQVNVKVKGELAPCADGAYPIDDRYVDLTADGKAELVLTLLQCEPGALGERGDKLPVARGGGYAVYVYNLASKPPTRLLAVEDANVEAVTGKGTDSGLIVIRNRWSSQDDPCCPTDPDISTYQWDGTKFIEVRR